MDAQKLRRLSKDLLGNKYRLEVATAVFAWASEPLSALTLADHTGLRYPRVQEELKRLEAIGMLHRTGSEGQMVEYKAWPSAYWEMCSRLHSEFVSDGPTPSGAAYEN